jgi:hypothetical protein
MITKNGGSMFRILIFTILLSLSTNVLSQELRYSECTNCDNGLGNYYTGSMDIPEEGSFSYGAIKTLYNNPRRIASDFGRRESNICDTRGI